MKTAPRKPNLLTTILVRVLSFGVLVFLARLAYVVTIRGKSCNSGNFCFFSVPETDGGGGSEDTSAADELLLNYYVPVFQDLVAEEYLSPNFKSLFIGTLASLSADALREIGVTDSISVSDTPIPLPFDDSTFGLVFSGNAGLDRSTDPAIFAAEVTRILRPGGFFVVHTAAKDSYSLYSLLDLFNSCRLIGIHDIDGVDASSLPIREIVLKKGSENISRSGIALNNSSALGYKRELIESLEPLIKEEPVKPWITLKRNVQNIRYLPSMVDISFKNKYVYIDVGARNYGSSIGSWFKKQYPKQNKDFEIYAIEADKAFHEEYKLKKGVTLLPYAAWIRNETLFFEINREPSGKNEEKVGGMGRIQSVQSSSNFVGNLNKIEGFDFAEWLMTTVSKKDFVVLKMDVEGSEFHLISSLVETGAIGLIDEMFLECHYNRWQRFRKGERSLKYEKTYDQCLELFSSLRERGVLVHQWW